MPIWMIATLVVVVVLVGGLIIVGIAMFSEMGTKRTTGKMKTGSPSSSKNKSRKKKR